MYISTHTDVAGPIRAYRLEKEPSLIWIKAGSDFTAALDPNEAQQLIAELQRELANVDAAARGVAA